MARYIGIELVDASPANLAEVIAKQEQIPLAEAEGLLIQKGMVNKSGYCVRYPDNRYTFIPKETFEQFHMEIDGEEHPTITQEAVDDFISYSTTSTIGEKTTAVVATMRNGFIECATSSCVDEANYDQRVGEEICLDIIKNRIWNHLGFLLQSALKGFNN